MGATERIQSIVESATIVLFVKGTRERPNCGASEEAIQLLDRCGAEYRAVDIQQDAEVRAFLPKFSSWNTFPQFYVQGQFMGGVEVMRELFEQGELQKIVIEVGAAAALAS